MPLKLYPAIEYRQASGGHDALQLAHIKRLRPQLHGALVALEEPLVGDHAVRHLLHRLVMAALRLHRVHGVKAGGAADLQLQGGEAAGGEAAGGGHLVHLRIALRHLTSAWREKKGPPAEVQKGLSTACSSSSSQGFKVLNSMYFFIGLLY